MYKSTKSTTTYMRNSLKNTKKYISKKWLSLEKIPKNKNPREIVMQWVI